MEPKSIELLTDFECDQEIGHLTHFSDRLTQKGRERLEALKRHKDEQSYSSSYKHDTSADDDSIMSAAIGFGLGSMFSSMSSGIESEPSLSGFESGGGSFGGAGAGSDF